MSDDIAPFIQHTLIAPGVSRSQLERHVSECVEHGFHAAMIGACWLGEARALLSGTGVKVATALDFPYGCMTTEGRVAEMQAIVDAGADEVDIGIQIGWLRSGEHARFANDLGAVLRAAQGIPVKAMLELPLLSPDERLAAVAACVDAGVAYLKNASSGTVGRATPEDIRWLRTHAPSGVLVKASGGIASRAQAVALLEAGAALLGTSAGVAIVEDLGGASSY
ncbi:MAG: deoxyribose-phosphate aldolase [Actinomycetota bacterium]|nr:deoxyribose-phosphate aldolase [Actinomycetota bacterium]